MRSKHQLGWGRFRTGAEYGGLGPREGEPGVGLGAREREVGVGLEAGEREVTPVLPARPPVSSLATTVKAGPRRVRRVVKEKSRALRPGAQQQQHASRKLWDKPQLNIS